MSIKKTQQQKISSLRRKDTMWIYKNPQGLQILEDVITSLSIKKVLAGQTDTFTVHRSLMKEERSDQLDIGKVLEWMIRYK